MEAVNRYIHDIVLISVALYLYYLPLADLVLNIPHLHYFWKSVTVRFSKKKLSLSLKSPVKILPVL